MMKNITFLLSFAMLSFVAYAQTPGVSEFSNSNQYIEYIPGNLPIIISAPHGGVLQSGETIGGVFYPDNDTNLPDRTCGTNERDDNTDILIRRIQDEIFAQTGGYAHVIINNLHRSKMDPNRMPSEASCGNSHAASYWADFHNYINDASQSVEANWGKGLYIDLHGQSHTIPRIEIGYNISATELNSGDLNAQSIIDKSTIMNLVSTNLNGYSHEELVRGENSLGQLFQEAPGVFYNSIDPSGPETSYPGCGVSSGYRAIPSNSNHGSSDCDDTQPYSNSYFDGNFYNNRRHGSGDGTGGPASIGGSGQIDGIMTEVNRRVRDLGAPFDSRPNTLDPFAIDYAHVILDYIQIHYDNFSEFEYATDTYDITDTDPTPTLTNGISGGLYLSTPSGLVIDQNTGTIDVSASTVGNYTVTYSVGPTSTSSSPNRYYSTSRTIEITNDLLSVSEDNRVTVKLFPNPTTGLINFESNILISEIKIFSILGQRVKTTTINSNETSVNLSDLRTGSYVMTFYVDNLSVGSKLIVKN
ncbi:T9SS type A sorting domain-containing protein [Psychroserpens sp. SPM9]|uniref:T9SS type A sorting domain-containing protein n=1 Tax=Psychroserpens sp. SPM9 TaxID=2975598 RepID=UPI0021A5AE31|nr:T9SS type A sorting domain-containing protein [Psychroserpens sp. SPM9]MDG5492804.1 T9SS type A sorting domain-containing protein [Psychroserpens sp. SPM9]